MGVERERWSGFEVNEEGGERGANTGGDEECTQLFRSDSDREDLVRLIAGEDEIPSVSVRFPSSSSSSCSSSRSARRLSTKASPIESNVEEERSRRTD